MLRGLYVNLFIFFKSLTAFFVKKNGWDLPIEFALLQKLGTVTGDLADGCNQINDLVAFRELICGL